MFAGSLVALVTPMQPDGSIDFNAWSRLLEFQIAEGSAGIVVAGSNVLQHDASAGTTWSTSPSTVCRSFTADAEGR